MHYVILQILRNLNKCSTQGYARIPSSWVIPVSWPKYKQFWYRGTVSTKITINYILCVTNLSHADSIMQLKHRAKPTPAFHQNINFYLKQYPINNWYRKYTISYSSFLITIISPNLINSNQLFWWDYFINRLMIKREKECNIIEVLFWGGAVYRDRKGGGCQTGSSVRHPPISIPL